MKESVDYSKAYIRFLIAHARQNWQAFMVSTVVLFAVYFASIYAPPGIVTYLLALPPSLIVLVTALARLNDMGVDKREFHWHLRRAAFVLAGAAAGMVIFAPLSASPTVPWRSVVLLWGVALAWLTTPNAEPWWPYITGAYREVPADYPRSPLDRILGRKTSEFRVDDLDDRLDR